MAEDDSILLNQSLGDEGMANPIYKWDFKLSLPVQNDVHQLRKLIKMRISRKLGNIKFNDSFEFVYKKPFPEGSYSGELNEHGRSGYGIMRFKSGIKYYGQWAQDTPHGLGFLFISAQNYYKGSLNKGKFSGYGEYILGEDYSYKGQFDNNLKHGYGIEKSAKEEYKGQFLKDKRQGKGRLNLKSGCFKGIFTEGTPVKGKFIDAKKSFSYSGDWVNENWEGKGVLKILTPDSPYLQMKGKFKSGSFVSGQLTTADKKNLLMTCNRRLF